MIPQTILQTICQYGGTTIEAIKSPAKDYFLSDLRKIYWKILKDRTGLSLSEIARMTGREKHSTVINGLKRFEEYYRYDPAFRALYDDICNQLNLN